MSELPEIGTVPEWTLLDRLRKAREWAGLSQEELGERLEIGRSTVSNYESGTTHPKRMVITALGDRVRGAAAVAARRPHDDQAPGWAPALGLEPRTCR